MGLVFAELVAPGQMTLPATRAYGSIAAYRGRVDLIKHASAAYFTTHPEPTLQHKLMAQLSTLDRASARRNDIAHGIGQPYVGVGVQTGYCLFPSYFLSNRRKIDGTPTYVYSSKEVARFGSQFRGLVAPLSEILDTLWAKRARS